MSPFALHLIVAGFYVVHIGFRAPMICLDLGCWFAGDHTWQGRQALVAGWSGLN